MAERRGCNRRHRGFGPVRTAWVDAVASEKVEVDLCLWDEPVPYEEREVEVGDA